MIIHKMNRVSGFIIIITGAFVRISEYHVILDILIKSGYTAVQYRGTLVKYRGIPQYKIFRGTQHYVKCLQICAHVFINRPQNCAQTKFLLFTCKSADLVIRALNCARFCVVCALNYAQILIVRALDCAQFILHPAFFAQPSWNTARHTLSLTLSI